MALDPKALDYGEAITLMRKARAVMRACGWHLAVSAEPAGDGILEAACTEIEADFADFLAGAPAQTAEASGYLVWSNQHHAWWRPRSRGYAKSILGAGIYTREEAIDISHRGRDGIGIAPDEIAVSLADVPDHIRAALLAAPPAECPSHD